MTEDITNIECFLHYFTVAVSVQEWALLYPAVVDRREPVSLRINGKLQRVTITEIQQKPERYEDRNVYLTGYYESPSMER